MMTSKQNIEHELNKYKNKMVQDMGGIQKLLEIAHDIHKTTGQPIALFEKKMDEFMTRSFFKELEDNTFEVETDN